MPNPNEILEAAQASLDLLEAERQQVMDRYDADLKKLREAGRHDEIAELQEKRAGSVETYRRYTEKQQAAVDDARRAVEKHQLETEKQLRALEEKAKLRARVTFRGTAAEFEAAWPEMWNRMRMDETIERLRNRPKPKIHL